MSAEAVEAAYNAWFADTENGPTPMLMRDRVQFLFDAALDAGYALVKLDAPRQRREAVPAPMSEPAKYRKKPVVIDAMLFDGENGYDVLVWMGRDVKSYSAELEFHLEVCPRVNPNSGLIQNRAPIVQVEDRRAEIVRLHAAGATPTELVRALHWSPRTVYDDLRALGLRPNKKHKTDA